MQKTMVRSARTPSDDTDSYAPSACDDSSSSSLGDFLERAITPEKRTVGSDFSLDRTATTQESTDVESSDDFSTAENGRGEDHKEHSLSHSMRVSMDGALYEVREEDEGTEDSPYHQVETVDAASAHGRILHRTASGEQLGPKPRSQSQLESVHQGSMPEACHQVNEMCDSKTKSIPQQEMLQKQAYGNESSTPQPDYGYGYGIADSTTDYGYDDATLVSSMHGYGDATPDDGPKYGNGDAGDAANKRGSGDSSVSSRKTGSRYEFGYGDQHDMDSKFDSLCIFLPIVF
jgi:hypothetical protein